MTKHKTRHNRASDERQAILRAAERRLKLLERAGAGGETEWLQLRGLIAWIRQRDVRCDARKGGIGR